MELKILNSQKDIDLFKKLKSVLVNSNLSADKDNKCPNCNGNHIIKHGKRNNIQRYKCKSCSKVFSERSNSIISNTKIFLDKWFMYIALLINKISIRKCSKILKISLKTSFFMRHKILDCLSIILKQEKVLDVKKINENDEEFKIWSSCFRGVSVKYLSNYLSLFAWNENIGNRDIIFKAKILFKKLLQININITIRAIKNRQVKVV